MSRRHATGYYGLMLPRVAVLGLLMLSAASRLSGQGSLGELKKAFENPPDEARIMVRWWWFGPAATKPEIERELRAMKAAGIGGVEVQATYPLALEGNFRYLSPEFLDALRFAAAKARELGLRMDLTLGSGWPFGGPHIPLELASSRLRVVRQTDETPPKLADGETLIATFPAAGQFEFFVAGHTRMMVKRPALGAEGFVLDHYSRPALDAHLRAVGEPMLGALRDTPPHAIFSDSLEVYSADWTPNFLEEFRKRRGYDLLPRLRALVDDDVEDARSVRHDWGKTLTELANDNYLRPLTEWAHRHGALFRSQTYGMPPVNLSSNALVDLPEGEGWNWRRFSATRWAASAGHLYGKPVISSETWTWLHSPVFRATPLDMKAEADLHFLQGINQLVAHGYPYSPPEAGEPGWRFYAAAVFNDHNPWWIVMPDITKYLQRVSFLLRQGKPANDVAVYLPTDDAWAGFTLGRPSINQAMDALIGPDLISDIERAGYNLDFIDDEAIAHARVPYRFLILPGVERIPLATLQRIDEFRKKGGFVLAIRRLPSLGPGVQDQSDTSKIRELASTFALTDEAKLGEAMHAELAPDVATSPAVSFVHRKLPFGELYFLVNTTNRPVGTTIMCRVVGLWPQWWDPMTGKTGTAAGNVLELAPYESRFLLFTKEPASLVSRTPRLSKPLDLSGGWRVTFPGRTVEMATLRSWTEDESTRYFSGQAVYQRAVNVPEQMIGARLFLDMGEGTPVMEEERRAGNGMRAMLDSPVREAAVVYVNNERAGSIWRPPYEVEVTGLLHAGQNEIRIVVANLALNAMAKGPRPDYKELTAKYGERFQPQDMDQVKPIPAGLLGPIRLVTK